MASSRLFFRLLIAHVALSVTAAPFLLAMVWRESAGVGAAIGFLGGMLLLGVGAAAVSWGSANRSRRDVRSVVAAAEAIGRDPAPSPLDVDLRSETAPLVQAFQNVQQRFSQRVQRLDEKCARLSTVLDGMEEGVVALDADRRVLLANGASRRLLQIASKKVIGRPLLEVVRSREVHAAVEQAERGASLVETEFEVGGDPRRHLHLRAKRLDGRSSLGVVIVVDDVSKLRRLENMRSEFAANVSHELKTPLASIKAYAETLRLGAVNDPDHNLTFVERIEEHADRLHFLILDLMHLARVESGKEVFEIADFPLDDLVEECVDYHLDSAEAKRIAVSVEPPETRLEVHGDEVGVRTILDNLVSNAIKYTPEGGCITVGWRGDGDAVLLEVSDTGIGIAAEDQERVFERFYRVDKARSRELGGTGLGLSIVKHTALALGGRVGLESRLGQGSTFRVWLPSANGSGDEFALV
ncbi:MAG: PAS domain-containing protein [Planctomycetes bacterium]|nr:PAS domain-containing protein [Planctomycetota bacterium]